MESDKEEVINTSDCPFGLHFSSSFLFLDVLFWFGFDFRSYSNLGAILKDLSKL